ncbi:MAG: hypothetical protein WC219_01280 [Acholeplasmataceae bacterium]
MKKLLIIITGVLVLLFLSTYLWNQNQIITIYFRHISMLAAIGILLYMLMNKLSEYLTHRFFIYGAKETILYISSVSVYTIVIVLAAIVQYKYINYSYVFQDTIQCSYYDPYDHLIYNSFFENECQTPTIYIQNESILYMQFDYEEKIETFETYDYQNQKNQLKDRARKGFISIYIEYDHSVISYVETETVYYTVHLTDEDIESGAVTRQIDTMRLTKDDTLTYVFDTAYKVVEFANTTYDDIMSYDANQIEFTEDNHRLMTYVATKTNEYDDKITYTMQKEEIINDQLISKRMFDYHIIKPNHTGMYQGYDYIIDRSKHDSKNETAIQLNEESISVVDTRDISRYTYKHTQTYKLNDGHFMFDSKVSNSKGYQIVDKFIEGYGPLTGLEEIDYSYHLNVLTFRKDNKLLYHMISEDYPVENYLDQYFTIEESSIGIVAKELFFHRGSFWQYLFNNNDISELSLFDVMPAYGDVIYHQRKQIDPSYFNLRLQMNSFYYTLPIFIEIHEQQD